MHGEADTRRGRWAFGLTATAFLWCVVLIIAAYVVPVYSGERNASVSGLVRTTSTLVGENGAEVLAAVALPAALTALVGLALHHKRSRASRSGGYVAWGLVGLLAAFSVLAMFSIGAFVLPVALLLAGAATLTPTGSRRLR